MITLVAVVTDTPDTVLYTPPRPPRPPRPLWSWHISSVSSALLLFCLTSPCLCSLSLSFPEMFKGPWPPPLPLFCPHVYHSSAVFLASRCHIRHGTLTSCTVSGVVQDTADWVPCSAKMFCRRCARKESFYCFC